MQTVIPHLSTATEGIRHPLSRAPAHRPAGHIFGYGLEYGSRSRSMPRLPAERMLPSGRTCLYQRVEFAFKAPAWPVTEILRIRQHLVGPGGFLFPSGPPPAGVGRGAN